MYIIYLIDSNCNIDSKISITIYVLQTDTSCLDSIFLCLLIIGKVYKIN